MFLKSGLSAAAPVLLAVALAAAPAAALAGESVKGGKRLPMTAKDLKNAGKPPFGAQAQDKPAEAKASTPTPPASPPQPQRTPPRS